MLDPIAVRLMESPRRRRSGGVVRKTVRCESKDRISNMPKNVLEIILEVLPIRDAVRTSVLSSKWRYRWASISQLVFDSQFFQSLLSTDSQQLNTIINKLLLLHIGSIPKYSLIGPPLLSANDFDLNQWLLFLSRNGIKELTLHLSRFRNMPLGSQLYSCRELTRLNLYNLKLSSPVSFEGFPNLTTLELCDVYGLREGLKFVSGCLLIEKLSIQGCSWIENLIISGLNITYLHIKNVVFLKTLCLNRAAKVLTLSITLFDTRLKKGIEKLVFGDQVFEFLAVGGVRVPKRLLIALDNLKNILFEIDFNDVAHISFTLCMIRSSPNLSMLEISGVDHPSSAIIQDLSFMADNFDHNCSLTKLHTVELKFYKALKTEMVLIKFLLAHSPLLENMFIVPYHGIDKDVSLVMCKELMQFGRASPKAAIVYLDPQPPPSR